MEEQEVELIDYLRVIWKRKGLIVGGTLLAAATALVVSLSMPKTYVLSRTLKIGILPGGIIENREAVTDRLRDQRFLRRAIQELQLEMRAKDMAYRISIDPKVNPHVRYEVQASDPRLATRIADWLAEAIITIHSNVFEKGMSITKAHEEKLVLMIADIETDIGNMKSTLATILKTPDTHAPPSVILLQANIEDRERNLMVLGGGLKEIRLSRLRYANTSVSVADEPPEHPIRPKVKLNVALAGTVGLMIFTFLAFFLEYLEKFKGKVGGGGRTEALEERSKDGGSK